MKASVTVESTVPRSARVLQVAGMMDVPVDKKLSRSWNLDLPLEDRDWNVGLITGASGAGKTTLARHLWPDSFSEPAWTGGALIDEFPQGLGIREIQGALSAAGLSSVPAWLRPYHTLSMGERFRADMARLLVEPPPGDVAVIDEFTSVVDRQVATVASHALQKAIRRANRRIVAVSCHYDVIDWLQPDWIVDAAVPEFNWRSVQPHPPVELEVHPCDRQLWALFKDHHYMSADLSKAARCFAAYVDGRPVAFTSYIHFPHATSKNIKMAHRIVVLPDWQGLGLAGHISEWMGSYLVERGFRYRITTAHPAFIHYMAKSPRWRMSARKKTIQTGSRNTSLRAKSMNVRGLTTRSFEYVPPARPAGAQTA